MWAATKKGASGDRTCLAAFRAGLDGGLRCFFTALSHPLLLLLISGAGWLLTFIERGRDAREAIFKTVSRQFFPEVSGALGDLLGRVQSEPTARSERRFRETNRPQTSGSRAYFRRNR